MKTAVLLSGGVDSSVALYTLKEQKYDITAFYLKIWLEDELSYLNTCPWEEDLAYARRVCENAGVPLKIISLQQEYFDRVVRYTIAELREGRTPSPDIFCNLHIKFGAFLDHIDNSYEKIASGHYAVIKYKRNKFYLYRSPDPVKDQTYFLSYLRQDQLARALFPIGGMFKHQVREAAKKLELPNMNRKDSQGICFLGKLKYNDFVRHYLGEKPGDIINSKTGAREGLHKGYWFHTVGQRQGLGLGNGPWYVSGKDIEKNIIYVTHKSELSRQSHNTFFVSGCSWINDPISSGTYLVKLRHGPKLHHAEVNQISADTFQIKIDEDDSGIAPGQFTVFYRDDLCLGAGKITVPPSNSDHTSR